MTVIALDFVTRRITTVDGDYAPPGPPEVVEEGGGGSTCPLTLNWYEPTPGADGSIDGTNTLRAYRTRISGNGLVSTAGVHLADPYVNSDTGRCYVLQRDPGDSDYTVLQLFEETPALTEAAFGIAQAVSHDGLVLAISADGALGDTGFATGRVYIYTRPSLETTFTLLTSVATSQPDYLGRARYGISIDLDNSGNTLAVGANWYPGFDDQVGAFFIYERAGSSYNLVYSETGGVLGNNLGWAVSLSGDGLRCAVSSIGIDSVRGAAYVYLNSGGSWALESSFVAPTRVIGEQFGFSLSLNDAGDVLAVGSPYSNSDKGRIWLFTRSGSTWTYQTTATNTETGFNVNMGFSIAVDQSGTKVLVGLPQATVDGFANCGLAYLYDFNGTALSAPTVYSPPATLIPGSLLTTHRFLNRQFGRSVDITTTADCPCLVISGAFEVPEIAGPTGYVYPFLLP